MEKIRLRSNEKISRIRLDYQRNEIRWLQDAPRLMGIKGARGVGKTTILLQHLRLHHGLNEEAIYLSLDDIYFTENRLIDFVEDFQRYGGKYLYLDEVHKYPDWAIEVKNIYDTYPDLKIVFTGSSMLEIRKANADLSRRAIIFHLQGLSFRQYLQLNHNITLEKVGLESLLSNPNDIISNLPEEFQPFPLFKKYLESGYYPFFTEGNQWYFDRLESTVQTVIETDFPLLQNIDIHNIRSIYRLLFAIATSPLFKPNVTKLSERIGIARNTLLQYLAYLEQADILTLLRTNRKGITSLQKPEKIYLENPNLIYTYNPDRPDTGAIRETFVLNQLKAGHQVQYPPSGDFLVDQKYLLEVGGKGKGGKQLEGRSDAYIVADDLDFAVGRKIPIYLFGLLY